METVINIFAVDSIIQTLTAKSVMLSQTLTQSCSPALDLYDIPNILSQQRRRLCGGSRAQAPPEILVTY